MTTRMRTAFARLATIDVALPTWGAFFAAFPHTRRSPRARAACVARIAVLSIALAFVIEGI